MKTIAINRIKKGKVYTDDMFQNINLKNIDIKIVSPNKYFAERGLASEFKGLCKATRSFNRLHDEGVNPEAPPACNSVLTQFIRTIDQADRAREPGEPFHLEFFSFIEYDSIIGLLNDTETLKFLKKHDRLCIANEFLLQFMEKRERKQEFDLLLKEIKNILENECIDQQ